MSLASKLDLLPVRHRIIQTEMLVWEGISILLSYEPDWLGLAAAFVEPEAVAHIELQVMAPRGAPLPLSDDGYWSDFLSPGEAAEAGGPKALAFALLQEFSHTQVWRVRRARWEQSLDSG